MTYRYVEHEAIKRLAAFMKSSGEQLEHLLSVYERDLGERNRLNLHDLLRLVGNYNYKIGTTMNAPEQVK